MEKNTSMSQYSLKACSWEKWHLLSIFKFWLYLILISEIIYKKSHWFVKKIFVPTAYSFLLLTIHLTDILYCLDFHIYSPNYILPWKIFILYQGLFVIPSTRTRSSYRTRKSLRRNLPVISTIKRVQWYLLISYSIWKRFYTVNKSFSCW